MQILMSGGHGFIGSHLIPLLDAAGHTLNLLARNPDRARAALEKNDVIAGVPGLLSRLTILTWDPSSASLLSETAAAFESAQAVLHLAGENIGKGRWTEARKHELRVSRIQSTERIVQALRPSTSAFLSASAVGIYPNTLERDSATRTSTKTKLGTSAQTQSESYFPSGSSDQHPFLQGLVMDWERAARTAEEQGRRVVCLRTGIVFGSQGFLPELLPIYRMGLGGPIGSGRQLLPWIHIRDLARAVLWILDHPSLVGPVNLVGPQPVRFADFSKSLAKVLKRPHLLWVPETALRLALGEKSELAFASCAALPTKLLESGFSFEFTECERALTDLLTR